MITIETPNITELLNDIGSLILLTGTDSFETAFYDTCQNAFSNDQCNVFIFDNDIETPPTCLLTTASQADIRDVTREASLEYVDKGYRTDPTLAWAYTQGLNQNTQHIRIVSPHRIENSHYRNRYYGRAQVRQKLTLITHSGGKVIYLNFYRTPDQSDFQSADKNLLAAIGSTLNNLVQKHLHLTQKKGYSRSIGSKAFSVEYRNQLITKMQKILVDDPAGLTPREAEVCAAIAIGLTAEGIALTFGVSVNTVATHRKRAYFKLGISSQNELFMLYHHAIASELSYSNFI